MKILIDQPFAGELAPGIDQMVDQAFVNYGGSLTATDGWQVALFDFLAERQAHIFERRGFRTDETRAVARFWKRPPSALKRIEALAKERGSADFAAVAALLKRVKNITKDQRDGAGKLEDLKRRLKEPAEIALAKEIDERWPKIHEAQNREHYADAMKVIVGLRGPVDRFFTDVLVMAEDPQARKDRLALLTMLRDTITQIADISEMAAEEGK
jgi:glycyl-tRNA synthetase beta chain